MAKAPMTFESLKSDAEFWLRRAKGPNNGIPKHFDPYLRAYLQSLEKIPWRVRLFVAVKGYLPKGYLIGEDT